MSVFKDSDQELASSLGSLRQRDEASAPAFREVLASARSRRRSVISGFTLGNAAAALIVLMAVLAFWSWRPHARLQRAATASRIADWRAPTDSLLHTPGIELWRSTPDCVPSVPDYSHWTPAAPASPSRERTPRGRLSAQLAVDLIGSLRQKGVEG